MSVHDWINFDGQKIESKLLQTVRTFSEVKILTGLAGKSGGRAKLGIRTEISESLVASLQK